MPNLKPKFYGVRKMRNLISTVGVISGVVATGWFAGVGIAKTINDYTTNNLLEKIQEALDAGKSIYDGNGNLVDPSDIIGVGSDGSLATGVLEFISDWTIG